MWLTDVFLIPFGKQWNRGISYMRQNVLIGSNHCLFWSLYGIHKRNIKLHQPYLCLFYNLLFYINNELEADQNLDSHLLSGLSSDDTTRSQHLIWKHTNDIFSQLHKRPFNNQLSLNSIVNPRAAASLHYCLRGHQLPSNLQWLYELFLCGCWDTVINISVYICYLHNFASSQLPLVLI